MVKNGYFLVVSPNIWLIFDTDISQFLDFAVIFAYYEYLMPVFRNIKTL